MENRHGLVVDACVVPATGTGERDAATSLVASLPRRRVTIGGDKGYDTRGFAEMLRTLDNARKYACSPTSIPTDRMGAAGGVVVTDALGLPSQVEAERSDGASASGVRGSLLTLSPQRSFDRQ